MIICEFENKRTAHLRHACATVLVLNKRKDALLLTKRASHLLGGGLWINPGGFIEMNQRATEAVILETQQEAGVSISLDGIVCISDTPERGDDGRQNILIVFAGVCSTEPAPFSHDAEVSEVRWYPISELPPEHEWAFDHHKIVRHFLTHGVLPVPLEHIFLSHD